MEELLPYAYLMFIDSDFDEPFEEKLNELFLSDPDNDDLLYLETLYGNPKESMIYITKHMDYNTIDTEKFGKRLMELLKPIYKKKSLDEFTDKYLYNIWQYLWGDLADKEPFNMMLYAGDLFLCGSKRKVRRLCRKMLSYYD